MRIRYKTSGNYYIKYILNILFVRRGGTQSAEVEPVKEIYKPH